MIAGSLLSRSQTTLYQPMNHPDNNVPRSVASLLFNCENQVEISSVVANFFAQRDLGPSRQQQIIDDNQYFCWLEWSLDQRWEDQQSFTNSFEDLARTYQANYSVQFFNRKQSVGLMVSRQSHTLREVLNKYEAGFFPDIEISFILGNDESMRQFADRHGTPFFHVATDTDALKYEQLQLEIVQRYNPDYIGLAHYTRVLSANFLQQIKCPIINIHPSFFPAIHGDKPFHTAYRKGLKLIGATSRFITAELDQGPIIEQDVMRIANGASEQDMLLMGHNLEQRVFSRALLKVLQHKVIVYKNRTIIFS